MTPSAATIIPAAGLGTRMKLDHPKQYHLLAGIPILLHTVRAFTQNSHIDKIVVVVPEDWLKQTRVLFDHHGLNSLGLMIVAGGHRRQDSVRAGLQALDDGISIVLVHDGARPFVSQDIINRCYRAAVHDGAGIAAVPVKDTLKRGDEKGRVKATIDRTSLWQAQTPQAVRKNCLKRPTGKTAMTM
jgi:2-C-methyl-D-erythritol 4-phosphate cytidylyltransferase/2-C-methyl-D-erythritol 2,4-cyclodiphosphate synthase